ncbi:UPAR/Ly6 domain-containing protein bero-like isoform X2 [Drosophila takahashii]|uniref:UPAR/Ly6 domain-containing protein bero-like isoform X2 n=1 Tax=Drosophila takahashii TaxID=29030 RepID=UPI003898DA09
MRGNTIRCYVCDDLESESCGLSDSDIKKCDDDATGCKKQVVLKSNQRVTYRDCYFRDVTQMSRGCSNNFQRLFIYTEVSCMTCTKDKCNGSSSLAPIGAIFLFLGVAGLLS